VTRGEEQKKEESKGFAGLSSLVSDVDTTPPPAPQREPAAAAPSAERPASPQPAEPPPQPSQRQTYQEPSQPSSGSSGKWLLGIAAVIGLLWLINFSNGNKSPTAPAYEPSNQTKNSDRGAGPNKTTELLPPKFSEYLSDIYDGPRAKVNLITDFDKNFRTRIRNTQSQPINFAGEYILSTWGCGTSCLMGVAVSARTGQVVELPGSVCCWKGAGERTIFKKNSRLLVLAGLINENGQHGAHFYELNNNEFIHIKTISVKEDELSPPSSTLSPATVAPTHSSPAQIQTPSNLTPLVQPQEQPRPNEEKPPVGSNLVFSTAQIHYCLAEDIRMESAKSVVNNYVDSDVDRFNAMVADYNSRCGSFRYRSGALESARQEIEQYRSQLQSEGRSRFARSSPDLLSKPSVAVVPPVSTPPVHAPSRQESTSPTNGGIPQNAHLNYLGNDWECNRGYYRAGNECQPVQMPRHATLDVYGSGWVCQRGYYKSGNECQPVQMPQNATLDVYGSGWVCQRGYYKSENECLPVQMPRNATLDVYGSGWVCQRGYYKSGNECHPVQMPPNATLDVYGSGWVCQRGYYKSSNQCLPVQLPQNATLDVYGSGWVCVRGYARVGDNCV